MMYHSRLGCGSDSCTNVLSAIIPTSLLRCLSGPRSQTESSHTFEGAEPLDRCPAAIIDTTLRTRMKPACRLCFDRPTTYFSYRAVYFEYVSVFSIEIEDHGLDAVCPWEKGTNTMLVRMTWPPLKPLRSRKATACSRKRKPE